MMWVRMPASLYRLLRSKPMQAPQRQETVMRRIKSRFWARENWLFKYSVKSIFCTSIVTFPTL